jgi:hypothetical protein
MNEHYGKPVDHAVCHGVMHYPGIGQFGPTLNRNQVGSVKVLDMTMGDSFVTVEVQGPQLNKATVLIPLTGFTHIVLAK